MTEPKMPTPEEMAKIEKSRTISDAELLKEGAEYTVDDGDKKRLELTEKQKREIKINMEEEAYQEELIEEFANRVLPGGQNPSFYADMSQKIRETTQWKTIRFPSKGSSELCLILDGLAARQAVSDLRNNALMGKTLTEKEVANTVKYLEIAIKSAQNPYEQNWFENQLKRIKDKTLEEVQDDFEKANSLY